MKAIRAEAARRHEEGRQHRGGRGLKDEAEPGQQRRQESPPQAEAGGKAVTWALPHIRGGTASTSLQHCVVCDAPTPPQVPQKDLWAHDRLFPQSANQRQHLHETWTCQRPRYCEGAGWHGGTRGSQGATCHGGTSEEKPIWNKGRRPETLAWASEKPTRLLTRNLRQKYLSSCPSLPKSLLHFPLAPCLQ